MTTPHSASRGATHALVHSLLVWLVACALVLSGSPFGVRQAYAEGEDETDQFAAPASEEEGEEGEEGETEGDEEGSSEEGSPEEGGEELLGAPVSDDPEDEEALVSAEEPAIESDEALTAVEDEDMLGDAIGDRIIDKGNNTFEIVPSGDTSGQGDHSVWYRLVANYQNQPVTIVFQSGKTYYFKTTLNIWSGWTVRGDNATIKLVSSQYQCLFLNGSSNASSDKSTGGYNRCKNITIDGGTYMTTKKLSKNGSFFQFNHGQNITIKNCTLQKDGGGHHIELAGCKNCTISNVRFRGTYSNTDNTNEAIQLDACHNSTNTPNGYKWDKTSCSGITISECDVNVKNQPVGIGTSHGKDSKGNVIKASHQNIKILNSTVCGKNYSIALKPNSTNCQIKNNKLKGAISTAGASKLTQSGNKTLGSWPSASGQVALSASNCTVRANPSTCIHTGDPKEPSFTVTYNGTTLRSGIDFGVVYQDNVEVGHATAYVVGKGAHYVGSVESGFEIIPQRSNASIVRLAGDNALATMQQIVQAGWSSADAGGSVIVATKADFKDALAAAGLGGVLDGEAPILLTDGNKLYGATESELVRLQPRAVYIVGGEKVVSKGVANAIKNATGVTPKRLAGKNSIETANAIARAGSGWSDTAILATNAGYKDALAAAPIAYYLHMPIFLTNGKMLASSTQNAMKACHIKHVIVVGGTAAISDSVFNAARKAAGSAERIYGSNGIQTSQKIAEWGLDHGLNSGAMGVATAGGYTDALCGAALMGHMGYPLVLSASNGTSAVTAVGKRIAPTATEAYIFGGTAAVGLVEENAIDAALVYENPQPEVLEN